MIRETVRLALSDPPKLFEEHGKLTPIKDLGDDIAPAISSVKVTERRVPGASADEAEIDTTKEFRFWDKNSRLHGRGHSVEACDGELRTGHAEIHPRQSGRVEKAVRVARGVKRFKVDNRRMRILTPDEQRKLIEASPRKLRALIALALIIGARAGELLGLKWTDVPDDGLTFQDEE